LFIIRRENKISKEGLYSSSFFLGSLGNLILKFDTCIFKFIKDKHIKYLNIVIDIIRFVNPQKMLDIGSGFGRYG